MQGFETSIYDLMGSNVCNKSKRKSKSSASITGQSHIKFDSNMTRRFKIQNKKKTMTSHKEGFVISTDGYQLHYPQISHNKSNQSYFL